MDDGTITLKKSDILEIIRIIKEPDEATKKKQAEEKARIEKRNLQMVAVAKAEEASRRAAKTNCSHKKPRGESAFSGQVHSDGLFHPICVICAYQPEPYQLREPHGPGGVGATSGSSVWAGAGLEPHLRLPENEG